MRKPRQKKQILAVIGDPVGQSLSPPMHNAAFQALGLPYRYRKIRVPPPGLGKFIRTQAKRLAGFNSTLPHKEALIKYMDWVSPQAKLIGAVNTVVNRKGRLFGFNTDGDGFLASLREQAGFSCRGKNIVLLGSGGAARSLAVAFLVSGADKLQVANRTPVKARRLCRQLAGRLKGAKLSAGPLEGPWFEKALQSADLIVNSTKVGLKNSRFEDFPWGKVRKKTLVSDIVYNPLITPFLREARRRGHPILTGEGMLIHQGALSFLLWTGQRPDTELMRRVVLSRLKGKS